VVEVQKSIEDAVMKKIAHEWYEKNSEFCSTENELVEKLNNWLKYATKKEKEILIRLFEKSLFFSKTYVFRAFMEQYDVLKNKGYTVFAPIESQLLRNNSSHMYLNEFATVSGISDYSIIPSIMQGIVPEEWKYIEKIVFLDDIIGTGKTVIDFFKCIKKSISDKQILLWIICITKSAKKTIEEYAKNNSLNICITASVIVDKAFCPDYIFSAEIAKEYMETIRTLEKRLWKGGNKEFYLGKDDSQCLVSFYNDTPNNTLSSFWFSDREWSAIFERKKKEKPLWLKDARKKRHKENYAKRTG